MARARTQRNGKLDEAMAALVHAQATLVENMATLTQTQATLTQTQAGFVQSQAALQAEMAAFRRETAERFARIEAILLEHNRILQALPDALGKKFGFRPPEAT
jgi:hypothetical protein